MIEFAAGAIAGLAVAVLCPKVYAWARRTIAKAQDRIEDHSKERG
jgi:hypothetical protein